MPVVGDKRISLYHERIGIYLLLERVVADDSSLLSLSHYGSVGKWKAWTTVTAEERRSVGVL